MLVDEWRSSVTDLINPGLLGFGRTAKGPRYVTYSEDDGRIRYSANGASWAMAPCEPAPILRSVTFGGGKFVAVGDLETDTGLKAVAMLSPDGESWNSVEIGDVADGMAGVAYGHRTYVSVGKAGEVFSSDNGIAWKRQDAKRLRLSGVAYGSGVFVGVGEGVIVSSNGGATWVRRPLRGSYSLYGVAFDGGVFAAPTAGGVLLSSDAGQSWDLCEVNSPYPFSCVAGGGGAFLAGRHGGLFASTNGGRTWTATGVTSAVVQLVYGDARFVALESGGEVHVSARVGASLALTRIMYPETGAATLPLKYRVTVRNFGPDDASRVLLQVSDAPGRTDEAIPSRGTCEPTANGYSCFLGNLDAGEKAEVVFTFVPPAAGVRHCHIEVSADEANLEGPGRDIDEDLVIRELEPLDVWHSVESPCNGTLRAIAYGNSGGPRTPGKAGFVSVGAGGAIAYSSDGEYWKESLSCSESALNGVTFAGNRFVAVGTDGIIVYSEDGDRWYCMSSGLVTELNAIAHGNGVLVAVGSRGRIVTKGPAGLWHSALSPVSRTLRAVAHGAGRFVAVGDGGRVCSSPDGVRWHAERTRITANLRGVTYAGGVFTAVGDGGAAVRRDRAGNWRELKPGLDKPLVAVTHGAGNTVAVGSTIATDDNVSWTQRVVGDQYSLKGAAFGNGRFVAVGEGGVMLRSRPVNGVADLKVSVSCVAGGVFSGGPMLYEIIVQNPGPSSARDVQLVDELQDAAAYIWAIADEGECALTGNRLLCRLGNLEAGAQARVVVLVRPRSAGEQWNGGYVSSSTADPDLTNNQHSCKVDLVPAPADQTSVAVTGSLPRKRVRAGWLVDIAITVANRGPRATESLLITDRLRPGLAFWRVAADGKVTTPEQGKSGVVGVMVPSLAPGATTTFTITARATAPVGTTIRNRAVVRAANAATAMSTLAETKVAPGSI